MATDQQFGFFRFANFDVVEYTLTLLLVNQSTQMCSCGHRVTNLHPRYGIGQLVGEVGVDIVVYEQPSTCQARLSIAIERGEQNVVDHCINVVNVREYNVRAFAAELQ
ncbi:hypothetical protein D3C87_1622000 [compost metagenome]